MARTKKTESVPVRIRFKNLENGNKSIYLDIYHDKKRRYEFLKLYLIPETSVDSKIQNEHTMKAANAIKAQRILDLANNKSLAVFSEKSKITLLDWLHEYRDRGVLNGKVSLNQRVHSTEVQLRKYDSKARLCDIDKEWFDGFVEYMSKAKARRTQTPFAKKTIAEYLGCIVSALNTAVDDGILPFNPGLTIDRKAIKGQQNIREYLTITEVQKLINTPCKRTDITIPFLFSCFCGLRLGDVRSLTWKDIIEDNGVVRIEKLQEKTKKMVYIPLNKQAQSYLPQKQESAEDKVFSVPLTTTIDMWLKRWAKAAGIDKKLSYHMSRHTFATMELTMGADLYTTSQLLGHSDLETTQVYAKIIDTKKENAVYLIDRLFD